MMEAGGYDRALAEDARLDETQQELLNLTWRMLNAIHTGDANVYADASSEELSCFEDVCQYRIDGLPFHLAMIRRAGEHPELAPARFDILSPRVQIYQEKTGIVTYTRLNTYDENGRSRWTTFNETRVFIQQEGKWKMVHFHRSPTSR
jgi:hypothetical protein